MSLCTFLLDESNLSNSSLQEYLANLLQTLLLREQQTQQNPRLLRVVHAAGNLVIGVLTSDISGRHLAVHSAV
jgi:hypothetical protein